MPQMSFKQKEIEAVLDALNYYIDAEAPEGPERTILEKVVKKFVKMKKQKVTTVIEQDGVLEDEITSE